MAFLLLLDLYIHLQVKIIMLEYIRIYKITLGRALCRIGVLA